MIDELILQVKNELGIIDALLIITVVVLFRRTITLTDFIMTHVSKSTNILTEIKTIIKGKNSE